MSGFSAEWLALREPYDAAARARELEDELARWAAAREGELRVLDLGAGTGSNVRHLAPRLPSPQSWILVELDPALVEAGRLRPPPAPEVRVAYRCADLARDLERVLDEPVDLVTCSALLDLVSAPWLERLVSVLRARDLAFLAALSFDGRIELAPSHRLDAEVVALVLRHQRTDKGFGPALGPEAASFCAALFSQANDRPHLVRSDWRLGTNDRALQHALVEGWAEAAIAIAPERSASIRAWRDERLEMIAAGSSRARVGHLDLLRLPRRQRRAP
ncbi:MAG: class I SAM-dependent methyltransferase [Geminicoccaceae bacterium]|nr:class I SAM-dependent methyltransferase [Geminicoccaceae bacterium]